MRCRHLPALCAAAILWLVLPGPAAAQDALPGPVLQALRQADLPADALAAVALPLAGPPWLRPWQHRAQVAMQPASTMKLVTSIVALDRLGPNHRGYTELRSAAALAGGTLQGDLVLKGGADPELGVPQFWALLLDLRQAGVTHIAGNLLVDRSLFRPARFDQGLPPFDESPEFPYNVIPDALLLAGNLLPLQIRATPTGVDVTVVPPLPGLEITSAMTLGERACSNWDDDWKPARVWQQDGRTRIEFNGGFPRDCTQRAGLQLIDRQELTERLFRALWQGLGGTWAGRALEQAAPADTRVLARRQSRPWGEVLRHLNKTSDNALTRLLFLELGVPAMAAEPLATTRELADRAVRQWLAGHGIADAGLVLDNGSGLSRSERITPWQLASMLRVAHAGRHAADLAMSLPVAGVDGGLRRRLTDSPAAGWARLKSGSLRNVVSLAGYVFDPEGRPWAVAIMVNHERAGTARPVLDALVDHLARHGPHGPARAPIGPQGEGP
ncbi:MAG: D-alanyl-D-alanine carboxypeptidase/D-alanyl-D-alanine-endopeptidase [Rubrivivax sp.]|nr:D-alanyl-D-alanine carboxypeptidase/D-alanyl-D-alanine-endopeptidase [Rubrivivax sp.]